MSTTVRPATASEASLPPAAEVRKPVTARSRGGFRVWIVVLVLAIVGLGGWQAIARWRPAAGAQSAVSFEVTKRSFPVFEEAKGELQAMKTTDIKCKVEGRTTIIWLIKEGTIVEKDELLVKLASDKIEDVIRQEEAKEASAIAGLEAAEKDLEILIDENASNIRKGELALKWAGSDYLKYIEGDAEKMRMVAKLDVERAEETRTRAEEELKNTQGLYDNNYVSKTDLDQKIFAKHEADRGIDTAKLSLEIFNAHEFPKKEEQLKSEISEKEKELERTRKSAVAKEAQKHADAEAKRANLLNTQEQLKKHREQLEACEIRAPTPGIVVYYAGHRWDPQKMTEGSDVHERQTLVTLPDSSVMLVKVRIHEAKTYKITPGQVVTVEIDAIPDRVFTGKVTRIAPLADSRNQWLNPDLKEYETEITLDQSGPMLKPGVTARAKIAISEVEDMLSVPPQSIFTKGGRHYVFMSDGGEGTPREVQLGDASSDFVAVVSGLEPRERILLSVSDVAKGSLPDLPSIEKPEDKSAQADAAPKPKPKSRRGGKRGGRRPTS